MPESIKNYPLLSLCLLIALMLLPNLDTLQVTIMEARNFITAREMILHDNWLLTTMNGEARYQKPPLPSWLSALSGLVFGVKSVFAMRLPAILMLMVLASYTYEFSRAMVKSRAQSMVNALILITSFYVVGITAEAPWDIYTHGFMMIGVFHLFKLFKTNKQLWKHSLFAGLAIGCSILSKGPVSIYALLLPFLIAYGIAYGYRDFKPKRLPVLITLLIALVLGGWWYLYVRIEDPATFEAITSKETGNWTSYNTRPFYYYWSFFTQSGIWTIPAFISLMYPYLKRRVNHYKGYRLAILWTIIAVVLLSIIPEKKSRYLMPVLIPLAITIGFYINYLFRKFKNLKDKRETWPVYFNFGLIASIGIAAPLVLYFMFKNEFSAHSFQFLLLSIVLFTLGVFILIKLKKKHIKHVFFLTIAFFMSVFLFGLPIYKTLTSDNYKPIDALAEYNTQKGINIYGLNYIAPETIWQYGDKIPAIQRVGKTLQLPLDEEFGMLANGINPEDQAYLKQHYTIKKLRAYDLNQASKDSKQYNSRLFSNYYLLTKK
ncbi:ArnT family glycosyltransferase [Lacinutrix salivirga]